MATISTKPEIPGVPDAVYKTATINGIRYRYIVALPTTEPVDTALLIHGFPDLAIGWKHQIAPLVASGYRVIVPDQIGYGGTEAPEELNRYSLRSVAMDMAAIVRLEVGSNTAQILLGGHDWGGLAAWRFAQWFPEMIKAIFVVCTPYIPPSENYIDLETIVKVPRFASFGYQLQFASGEVEKATTDEKKLRGFLAQLFGSLKEDGTPYFSTSTGTSLENLEKSQSSRLVSKEDLDLHAKEMAPNGMRGGLNWYRTRKVNFDEERGLDRGYIFNKPALFIQALRDLALKPEMAQGMEAYFTNLKVSKIDATHWVLVEKPDEVNAAISKWLKEENIVPSPKI